jgi:hypothetical protein
MKPIPDWKKGWRFTSVQAAAALFFFSALQADVLPLLRPVIPERYMPLVAGAVALLIIVFRLWSQPGLHQDEEAGQEPRA